MIAMLADFHFIRPLWLLLLPLAVALWWLRRGALDPLRAWRSVMDPELLAAQTVGASGRGRASGWPLLAAWAIAVLAVAGPTWRPEPSPFSDDPVPVMIVLKAGESMALDDLAPSRMERARLKVADFAELRKGQPLGLLAYSGTAHLVLPPTRDTTIVAQMAAEIGPEIMPKEGDGLAAALEMAERACGDRGGSIVVIADSVPLAAESSLQDFAKGSQIPVQFLAVAREDSPELDSLEAAGKALGARVAVMTPDSSDVEGLARRSTRSARATAADGESVRWEEAGWWLVPPLAILVLLAFRREREREPETREEVPA